MSIYYIVGQWLVGQGEILEFFDLVGQGVVWFGCGVDVIQVDVVVCVVCEVFLVWVWCLLEQCIELFECFVVIFKFCVDELV